MIKLPQNPKKTAENAWKIIFQGKNEGNRPIFKSISRRNMNPGPPCIWHTVNLGNGNESVRFYTIGRQRNTAMHVVNVEHPANSIIFLSHWNWVWARAVRESLSMVTATGHTNAVLLSILQWQNCMRDVGIRCRYLTQNMCCKQVIEMCMQYKIVYVHCPFSNTPLLRVEINI